jgi:hypothetical protein
MRTIAMHVLAAGLLLSAFSFTGCKKAEAGPAGPQGPQGPQGPVLTFINSGFVTGTISGTRKDDGVPFNEPFSYTYLFNTNNDQLDSVSPTQYYFNLSRYTNDIFSSNSANLNIQTNSKTATTGTLNLYFILEKALGGNKVFSFSANTFSSTVTGLSYNQSSGAFTGNFNVAIPGSENSTGNTATFTGSFQATLVRVVNFKQTEAEIKAD